MVRRAKPGARAGLTPPRAREGSRWIAYADGSCLGNPGPGGWGVVLIAPDGARSEFNGHEPATTNNRMEITAAIEALRRIPAGAEVVLRSDSEYVVNTMTRGWKRNANRELWGQLDDEVARRMVNFEWVRGHGGDPLNDRADELALMGAHEKLAAASRPSDEARESSAAQLLRAGESIRRCAGCGRSFVAASEGDRYCSLVDCQRQARRDG